MIPMVKAQLLAFLIYTTPALLQQQLQGVGQAEEEGSDDRQPKPDLEMMLPGPCPVLRRLVAFDPGMPTSYQIDQTVSNKLHFSTGLTK